MNYTNNFFQNYYLAIDAFLTKINKSKEKIVLRNKSTIKRTTFTANQPTKKSEVKNKSKCIYHFYRKSTDRDVGSEK